MNSPLFNYCYYYYEKDVAVSNAEVKSPSDLKDEEKQADLLSIDTAPLKNMLSSDKDEDKKTNLLSTGTSPLTEVSSTDKGKVKDESRRKSSSPGFEKQAVNIGPCINCCHDNSSSPTNYEERDTETSSIDDSYSSPSPVPSLSKGLQEPSSGDEEFHFTAAESDFSEVEDEYMASEAETELTSVEDEYMGSDVELMDDDYMYSEAEEDQPTRQDGLFLVGDPELAGDGDCSISVRELNPSSVEYPLSEADKSLVNAVDSSDFGEVTKALLQGASIDCMRDYTKRTPLHTAALNGDSMIVKLLLTSGASINQRDTDLKTPLHLAAARGHEEVCLLLMGTGANPFLRSAVGWTPMETAALWGNYYLADILRALSNGGKEQHESPSKFYGC